MIIYHFYAELVDGSGSIDGVYSAERQIVTVDSYDRVKFDLREKFNIGEIKIKSLTIIGKY